MINDRRLRDCYQSANPPTRQQFDRYLADLTHIINYMRTVNGTVYIPTASPPLLIIRRSYPPQESRSLPRG